MLFAHCSGIVLSATAHRLTHPPTHLPTQTPTHPHTHTTHTPTHTHTPTTHTHTHKHTPTHPHTHTHTQPTHTRTNKHTHTHTNKQTHTHTHAPRLVDKCQTSSVVEMLKRDNYFAYLAGMDDCRHCCNPEPKAVWAAGKVARSWQARQSSELGECSCRGSGYCGFGGARVSVYVETHHQTLPIECPGYLRHCYTDPCNIKGYKASKPLQPIDKRELNPEPA